MSKEAFDAFCVGAQICPTDCDDTCPADESCATLCHELGKLPAERDHDPVDCPSSLRGAS